MLHSLMTCPYSYYLRYVKKVKLQESSASVYGTAVHRTIKIGYDSKLSRDEWAKVFKREWMNLTSSKIVVMNGDGDYLKKFKKGQEQVMDYYDKFVKDNPPPKYTELFFGRKQGVTLGNHIIIGVFDLIDFDDKIVDFKTGVKPTQSELDLDLQFTIYSYAYRQLYGKEESGITLRHLGTMKDLVTTRTNDDFVLLLDEVNKIDTIMTTMKDNPIYTRNLDRGCANCYFLEECLGRERKIGRFFSK